MYKLVIVLIFLTPTAVFSQLEKEYEFIKVIDGLHFPEGPAWDGNGNLYVSSCYGGYITKISRNGSVRFMDSTLNENFKQTNGLVVYKNGNIFACDYGLGAILKISPEGKSEVFVDGYEGMRFSRPNDLAFDNNDNLYFTDPNSYGADKLDGRIFKINIRTKEVTLAADSLAFPNGVALSAEGNMIYVSESALNRIVKFDLDSAGMLIHKKVFAKLPGGDPDGLAFDAEGNLYVAHFGGGAIYVIKHDGSVKHKILTPGKKPSNLEFGNEDMKTLFISENETNSIYLIQVEIPGLKLFSSP